MKSYKIALHNPFLKSAETASCISMEVVGKKLGHNIKMFHYIDDINNFQPDFVIAFHSTLPKLTEFPTYGPINANIGNYKDNLSKEIISWDGYCTASPILRDDLIKDICYSTNKTIPNDIFYTSAHCLYDENNKPVQINIESLKNPSLIYVGNNWDNRHLELLELLSKEEFFKIFGPSNNWDKVPEVSKAYKGSIPYDEMSLIKTYRNAGVVLAIQSNYFTYDDCISNRIFEANSAGAVVIINKMPFIEKYYKDSVLYVDTFLDPKETYQQVLEHMDWIKNNPQLALKKAIDAQNIFYNQLCLEKLLPNIIQYHEQSLKNKFNGFTLEKDPQQYPEIAVIVRTGGRNVEELSRALDSINNQIYPNVRPIICIYKKSDYLEEFLLEYKKKFHDKMDIIYSDGALRSTVLWCALKHIKEKKYPLFACLDDDDELFPNHFTSLYEVISAEKLRSDQKKIFIALCFSVVQKNEKIFKYFAIEDRRKTIDYPVCSNIKDIISKLGILSFLCEIEALDQSMLIDPLMESAEDSMLYYELFRKAYPCYSYRTSALVNLKRNENDPDNLIKAYPRRQYDMQKFKTRFYGKRFIDGSLISDNISADIEYPRYVTDRHLPFKNDQEQFKTKTTNKFKVIRRSFKNYLKKLLGMKIKQNS